MQFALQLVDFVVQFACGISNGNVIRRLRRNAHLSRRTRHIWGGHTLGWQERGTAFDDSLTVLAGAEQGIGLALTRWSLAAQDLASGRIVRASKRTVPCPRSYYFVCPEMYVTMPKVQQLLAWLREMAAAFPRPGAAAEIGSRLTT